MNARAIRKSQGVWPTPAIGSDGTICIGSYGKLYALDGNTGKEKWISRTENQATYDPAIGPDGAIYVGILGGKFYALDGVTGKKKWKFETIHSIQSCPAISHNGGIVYVGTNGGKLYALQSATGDKLWEFSVSLGMFGSPAIGADGTVYVGVHNSARNFYANGVYALDGKTGKKKWESPTTDHFGSAPAIGPDGTVYFGSYVPYGSKGRLTAIDKTTGVVKWQFFTESGSPQPSITSDGTVYVVDGRKMCALDANTGQEKWELSLDDYPSSYGIAIGADGTIYTGTNDGNVYAIR